MIDSHAHILKENYENINNIIHEIKEKGVIGVINASDKLETAYEVLELSKKYNNYLFPAIGIHPEHVNELNKLE